MSDIEYKKILHYIMMTKSSFDLRSNDEPQAKVCLHRCIDMLLNDYFTYEELEFLVDIQTKYHIAKEGSRACREIIDEIFKIMGIYKEPSYIVE